MPFRMRSLCNILMITLDIRHCRDIYIIIRFLKVMVFIIFQKTERKIWDQLIQNFWKEFYLSQSRQYKTNARQPLMKMTDSQWLCVMNKLILVNPLSNKPGARKPIQNTVIKFVIFIRARNMCFIIKFCSPIVEIPRKARNVKKNNLWESFNEPFSSRDLDSPVPHRINCCLTWIKK